VDGLSVWSGGSRRVAKVFGRDASGMRPGLGLYIRDPPETNRQSSESPEILFDRPILTQKRPSLKDVREGFFASEGRGSVAWGGNPRGRSRAQTGPSLRGEDDFSDSRSARPTVHAGCAT